MHETILTLNDKETRIAQSIHQGAKTIWLNDFGHAGDVLKKYALLENVLLYSPKADELLQAGISKSTIEMLARTCPEQF